MRGAATVLALVLAGCGTEVEAAPPGGAVQPVARVGSGEGFALAGDTILHARVRDRIVEVRAGERVVHRFEAPEGTWVEAGLLASPQLAVLRLDVEEEDGAARFMQTFTGPPAGPWEPLTPLIRPARTDFFPALFDIEGGTLFTTELRGDYGDARFTVREPGSEAQRLDLTRDAVGAVFAGDLVAYGVPVGPDDDYDAPDRLIVRDWRTGEVRLDRRIRGGVEALDMRPDGRIVINEDGGGIVEVRDGKVRRLTRAGVLPRYAGDRIVYLHQSEREGDQRLKVVEPGGRVRSFGVPTAEVKGFDVDATRVLWSANGCLLVADVTAPAASAPAPGPCPRSEVFLDDDMQPTLDASRRVPLILRCVAAAPPGCRGTVKLRGEDGSAASAPLRFRIPTGRRRRVVPRLTPRAYRAAIREGREGIGGASFEVEAITVDPSGRRAKLSDGYAVLVPRRLSRAGTR